MEPRSPSKLKLSITGFGNHRRLLKIGVILFVVVLLLFGVYCVYEVYMSRNGFGRSWFTVVVDCGSTGTRVNVYELMIGEGGDQGLPKLVRSYPDNSTTNLVSGGSCRYHCMQTEPGLDKFVGNISGVRASLEPLLSLVEKWVPQDKHKYTPIFVLATAGLRRLGTKEARRVLDDVEGIVKEHSFMYRKSWIRVLSGKEEAYYGWVALNFKLGSFGNSWKLPSFGILDLGGSSLQVVLEVDDATDDAHLVRSKIGSLKHNILAYSLLEFGLNEAFDRSVFMLSKMKSFRNSNDVIMHPCFGSDFVQNYTCFRCHALDVAHEKNSSGNIQTPEYQSLKLVGAPDWEQCKALARATALNLSKLELSEPKDHRRCQTVVSSNNGSGILNLTALAQHHGRFHALSGFSVVYNALNLSSRANFTNIWEQGKRLCSSSWAGLISIPGKYSEQRCFQVPFVASLIEEALCLGNAEMMFDPGDISWTLGAALVEGKYSGLSASDARTKLLTLKNMGNIPSPLLLFLLLLCLFFVVYCSQIKLPMPGRKGASIETQLPSFIRPKRRPN